MSSITGNKNVLKNMVRERGPSATSKKTRPSKGTVKGKGAMGTAPLVGKGGDKKKKKRFLNSANWGVKQGR